MRPHECGNQSAFNFKRSGAWRYKVRGGKHLSSASAKPGPTQQRHPARVDFPTQIKPILEARCQPCHFSGGKVYDKMPFDRPETIKTLGTKLFTRIKDENERRLIRDFLAQD